MTAPHSDNWDVHWQQFAEVASRNPAQAYRHRTIIRLLRDQPVRRLLDIGSGQGDFLVRAARAWPNAELCGFEMSSTGVAITRRKVPHAQALVVNLFDASDEAARYRGWATHCVCSEVLEHVDDAAALLRAAADYLADGACLIVTVPAGPMSAFDRRIGHRRHFTTASISGCLREGGFTPTRVFRAGFPFFNLYRLMVIARGDKLVDEGAAGKISWPATAAMRVFNFLFRFNLARSGWGWQIVAAAQLSRIDRRPGP